MTVKSENGRYIVHSIWPDGKRTRRTAVNRREAEKLDVRIRASRLDGSWRDLRIQLGIEKSAGGGLRGAVTLYLEKYVRISNRDQVTKSSRLEILLDRIGDVDLVSIDARAAAWYSAVRIREGVSRATVNRDLAVLRHLLAWSVREGLVMKNGLEDWKSLPEDNFQGPKPEESSIDEIFRHLDPGVRPIFEFLRSTGCRRGEGISLRWPQIDFRRSTATFYRTKSGRPRTVPIPTRTALILRSLSRKSPSGPVFLKNGSRRPWRDIRGPWFRARAAAGFPELRIHDLRHAYAIRLTEEGLPMEVVSEMLGHHSIDFTRRHYAKYAPSWAGRRVLEALDRDPEREGNLYFGNFSGGK